MPLGDWHNGSIRSSNTLSDPWSLVGYQITQRFMTGWMFLDLWAICGYLGTFTDDIPMSVFFGWSAMEGFPLIMNLNCFSPLYT